jgi:hypothetical protein
VITQAAVYDLPDRQLVLATALLADRHVALQLPLTAWELSFIKTVSTRFALEPVVSWKQRRVLRDIVLKYSHLLEYRAEFNVELHAALESVK